MKHVDPSELNVIPPVSNDEAMPPVARSYPVTWSDPTASNPLHANITDSPRHTPDPVRIGLAVWSARYGFRGLYSGMVNPNAPKFLTMFADPVRAWRAAPLLDKINARLAEEKNLEELFPDGIPKRLDEIGEQLLKTTSGQKLEKDIATILKPWELSDKAFNTVQHAVSSRESDNILRLTKESRAKIPKGMSHMLFELAYDNTIGLGSLAMTHAINKRVRRDINNMYAEAVGYETSQDPNAVTMNDIKASHNEIIQSTVKNYHSKLTQRLGISALPFLRMAQPLRSIPLGEMALGAWGVNWAFDVWGREPTMLELFSEFVNDKLNPTGGIADPVKTSDVISLYQRYAFKFHPDQAFKSVRNDPGEIRMWERSEKVFDRVAQLMNDSYNFKHIAITDPNTGQPLEFANFTFPKFIYLLGHNLIDAHQPDWSMAYVEVANTYGMEAVKDVQRMQKSGRPLDDVLKDYHVDLNPNHNPGLLRMAESPELAERTERGIPVMTEDPDASISAHEVALHGKVENEPQQHAPQH